MDTQELMQEYWGYANRQQAKMLAAVEESFSRLSDEVQTVLDWATRIELAGNLPKAEVKTLHRRIAEWKQADYADAGSFKLYLNDLAHRSRVKGDQALFLWMLAASVGSFQRIISADIGTLNRIAENTARREWKTLGATGPPPKVDIAGLLETLPDGTRFRSQMYDYAQYLALRLADGVRQSRQQGWLLNVEQLSFRQILRAGKERLLKASVPSTGQKQGFHGYLDRVMAAVVGYTVMRVFRSAGIEKYQFLAVLDSRTTDACYRLNGKVFRVDEMRLGVNVPPITTDQTGQPVPHPCRSIIRAVYSGERLPQAIRSAGESSQEKPHTFRWLGAIDFQDENAVQSLIDAFIQNYEASDQERCLVISKSGDVFLVFGDSYTVDTAQLGEKMNGSINIHNHPAGVTQYSFSHDDDMQSFYEDGSARMLAFDDRYLYEIRRPSRMPPRAEYDAVISKAWQNKWKLLEQTGIPESEYEDQVVHTVIRTACEQLGIYYERRKRR